MRLLNSFNFLLIGFFKKDGKVKKGKRIEHNNHMKLCCKLKQFHGHCYMFRKVNIITHKSLNEAKYKKNLLLRCERVRIIVWTTANTTCILIVNLLKMHILVSYQLQACKHKHFLSFANITKKCKLRFLLITRWEPLEFKLTMR